MNVLITGGAGFIGRWTVARFLEEGHQVSILDDFSSGSVQNIIEFAGHPGFKTLISGDLKDRALLKSISFSSFDVCVHLAALINVQDSIDDPWSTFSNDVVGTFHLLDFCRKYGVKMVYVSTCMVYDRCTEDAGISEKHPVKPASPYAGAKLSGEDLVLSYFHTYGLPVVILRPFNTYGPYQKSNGEGGVIPIFIQKKLKGEVIDVYGDGQQTRDFLYVKDCADFIVKSALSDQVKGEILNAGSGTDIPIKELALQIAGKEEGFRFVPHIHPQSEIMKLKCDSRKAETLLGWRANTPLLEGLRLTEDWLKNPRHD